MKIESILLPTSVTIDQVVRTKEQLIGAKAAECGRVCGLAPHAIAEVFLSRERLGSTGVGAGIAIPHARIDGLAQPMAVVMRLRKPIAFDAIDDQPVDIVMALLLPQGADAANLACLAAVSRLLRDRDLLKELRRAPTAEAIYDLLVAAPARSFLM